MEAIKRREFLGVLAGAVFAPYVCRNSGLLMPIADRSLLDYVIQGRDERGEPAFEWIRVPRRGRIEHTPQYMDAIFKTAHERGNLQKINVIGYGPMTGAHDKEHATLHRWTAYNEGNIIWHSCAVRQG